MQLFGLRKTPDLSHAPRQALVAFEHDRAQIQRRAVGQNRPFAHSARTCRHKSTYKPSNLCAGKAGMSRLYLYARVRFSKFLAHETAGAASARPSLRPSIDERGKEDAKPGHG